MKYTINTCTSSTLSSIACLVAYAFAPQDFIYISIYLSFGKLFFMSLLATLNNRGALSAKYTRVPIGSVPSWIGALELVENADSCSWSRPAMPVAPTASIVSRPHRTHTDRGTSFPSQ
ncbi:hypothetical protein FPV67DRAFT_1484254 [Lyophyllum atratum]|nr:hypothetical protein FPV67DRAFT_1484254 [Lyophyllum atratum]